MKCLSLWQPWASLVIAGHKTIETRSWATAYRGTLAIHAAKKWDPAVAELCTREPFASLLTASYDGLPRGVILGTVELVDCVPTTDSCRLARVTALEMRLGDFGPGRFAWILKDRSPLVVPIACRGRQGLFEVEL